MTDRSDLDDVEQPTEGDDRPNPGDWLWRGEGSPEGEPATPERRVDIGADDFADGDTASGVTAIAVAVFTVAVVASLTL